MHCLWWVLNLFVLPFFSGTYDFKFSSNDVQILIIRRFPMAADNFQPITGTSKGFPYLSHFTILYMNYTDTSKQEQGCFDRKVSEKTVSFIGR